MLPVIFALAWPTMLEELMQTLVQYIDTAMVGALGTEATAAVGATSTVGWMVGSSISALGVGFLAYIAKACGAGRKQEAHQASAQAAMVACIVGALFTALTLSLSPMVPVWMQVDPAIRELTHRYFFILYVPMLFRTASILFGTVLRAAGDTKTPMRVGVLMNLINIVLNFLLIYPTREISLFSHTVSVYGAGMGVEGAAIASAISYTVGGVLITAVLWRHPMVSPKGCSLRPDGRELRLTPTPDALDRPSAQVGFRPIPFEATTTDGRRVRFPEDFAGRYVLLDFWSLSCPPCLMDIRDHYLRDYAAYREAGFEILGVARNTDEDLRGNLPDLGIVWPVVADRPEGRITGCYRVDAYPTLYLIDPRGRIVAEGSDLRGERLSRWLRQAYPGVQPSPQTE